MEILDEFTTTLPNFVATKFTKTVPVPGFQICTNLFNLNHLEIVLKLLAQLHAGSIAYEERKTYRLDQDHDLPRSMVDLTEAATLLSPLLDNKNVAQMLAALQDRQTTSKFRRTLCHGHLVSQNIVFKYQDGEPVDCKLLDFSGTYTPPICDVLQLIFFNSGEDVRQSHFDSLLAHYWNSLVQELRKYSVPVLPDDSQLQAHFFSPLVKLKGVLLHHDALLDELKEDLDCHFVVSRQDCYTVARNKLKTTDFSLQGFTVTPLDSASGFQGSYYELQIKVWPETINGFIKAMPDSATTREMAESRDSFVKEAFVFQTLVPKFLDAGIDIIGECLPECYFQRFGDIMVFENLAAANFQTASTLRPLDFATLVMVVKKLAKFHASGFIYEERKSEELGRVYRLNQEYGEYFKETMILRNDSPGARSIAAEVQSVLDAAHLFPDENLDTLERKWPKFRDLFYTTLEPTDQYRNVLSHGDLWASNILLKKDNSDCRFIDYQVVRYCPPGHDLLSILYLTALRSTRVNHEADLARVYYTELETLLRTFGYDVASILPFADFTAGMAYMRPQMVMQAAFYAMLSLVPPEQMSSILSDEEEAQKIFFGDRRDFLTKMCETSDEYKSRLGDCIRDVYDCCKNI